MNTSITNIYTPSDQSMTFEQPRSEKVMLSPQEVIDVVPGTSLDDLRQAESPAAREAIMKARVEKELADKASALADQARAVARGKIAAAVLSVGAIVLGVSMLPSNDTEMISQNDPVAQLSADTQNQLKKFAKKHGIKDWTMVIRGELPEVLFVDGKVVPRPAMPNGVLDEILAATAPAVFGFDSVATVQQYTAAQHQLAAILSGTATTSKAHATRVANSL